MSGAQSSTWAGLAGLAVVCFVAGAILCEVVRRVALRRALVDAVNERSLHTVPKPRLGGVAIVVVTLVAAVWSWSGAPPEMHVLVIAGAGVALLGLADDLRPMSAGLRIALQLAAAIAFVSLVGTPPLLVARGAPLPLPPFVVSALLVVWMVGLLNIYNFMDGMDGLAGFQAVSAALVMALMFGGMGAMSAFALALGASSLGFLAHNFPPARIFMGDAGSTFIGFSFAALAILGMHHEVPITASALPLAPFLLDGTFTILRRASRGEKVWKAHRSHLYQRAVQTGLGHRQVLWVYIAWLAASAIAGLVAMGSTMALVGAWGGVTLGLVLVWRWVVGRERSSVQADRS